MTQLKSGFAAKFLKMASFASAFAVSTLPAIAQDSVYKETHAVSRDQPVLSTKESSLIISQSSSPSTYPSAEPSSPSSAPSSSPSSPIESPSSSPSSPSSPSSAPSSSPSSPIESPSSSPSSPSSPTESPSGSPASETSPKAADDFDGALTVRSNGPAGTSGGEVMRSLNKTSRNATTQPSSSSTSP
ncbi:hypothetical protein IQ250_09730 [Pseudanabaenaceae cyanobacterium LEGE 13415]|nr:hypothetical protein [Pseudanabaenaceae cyanobacterium LEGE 13415]